MSKEREESLRLLNNAKESSEAIIESWIVDLTDQDQPETCGIEDEGCEACGS